MEISCRQSDWQPSSLAQICSTSFPRTLIPAVEHHYIHRGAWPPNWQDDIEISQWLELLHPFTAVKDLYISEGLIPHIAPALKELVGERVSELLPALQTLFFTGDTLGTCTGSYWAVHCGATDCRSTHHYFPLGWKVVLTLTSASCFYPFTIGCHLTSTYRP